jgi:hypothetical protein
MGFDMEPCQAWVPRIQEGHPTYRELTDSFDLDRFIYFRPPIDLGHSGIELKDSDGCINVLRMPIKYPNSKFKIPSKLEWLKSFLQRIIDYEWNINPIFNNAFAHITIDRSLVKKGDTHRYPGFHGDGVQGQKLTPKRPIEHSYIFATAPSTEFCLQPFFLKHLDEAKHNYFLEFDAQAKEVNVVKTIPEHLYLIDPYMVHRTPLIKKTTDRLFVRVTFVFAELDHDKNTINPLFPKPEYKKRVDIRKYLSKYPTDIPLEFYGITK